jgi:hypothetical protein
VVGVVVPILLPVVLHPLQDGSALTEDELDAVVLLPVVLHPLQDGSALVEDELDAVVLLPVVVQSPQPPA